jgi:uncharacterized membrane protein
MLDILLTTLAELPAKTALPNLHAALVHFPLALLFTAFLFDIACLFARRQVWMDRAASALYILGTIGAGASFLTGKLAVRAMAEVEAVAQVAVGQHEKLALVTLTAFGGVTVLRFLVSWLARGDDRLTLGFFRLVALIAALAAQVVLFVTADSGGALVYRYGLGVGSAYESTATDSD